MTTNVIWHLHIRPYTQLLITQLDSVQHCAVNWVTGEYHRMGSETEMLAKFGWETLEVRWSKITLAMFYKILNNSHSDSDNPSNH